jgi:Ca2+-binding RTX toxin-like protein
VTFYSCTTNACGTKTSLGTETLSGGKATYSTSALPVGTTYVEAVYSASGNYGGSTSNVVSQVVNALGTSSVLTSSPNPSSYGTSVTFTDTVSASSGTPTGTVTFYSCTTNACGTKTSLGTETLSGGKATYSTLALPVGTTYVEAVYSASGNYGGSTSNVVSQVVNTPVPSVCASGGYGNVINGGPADAFLYGTNGNDLIYASGASYWIDGFGGNDCIDAGDGNNVIFDGNGNDGVAAGNGSDTVILGDGNDKVSLGNGSDAVEAGDGNDTVSVGNGSQSEIIVGNGNETVTVGPGSYNQVDLGSGTDTVTIAGSHDVINGGNGNETIYLGSGTYNSYNGQAHHTNICHLPTPPLSYHGTSAAYYHDTLTNCTVVSP